MLLRTVLLSALVVAAAAAAAGTSMLGDATGQWFASVVRPMGGNGLPACPGMRKARVKALFEKHWDLLNACDGGTADVRRLQRFYSDDVLWMDPNVVLDGRADLNPYLEVGCATAIPNGFNGATIRTTAKKVVGNTVLFTAVFSGATIKDFAFQGVYTFCKGKFTRGFDTWDPAGIELK